MLALHSKRVLLMHGQYGIRTTLPAQLEDQARVLASGKGLSPNYTFYLAAPNFVKQYPKAVPGLIKQINR